MSDSSLSLPHRLLTMLVLLVVLSSSLPARAKVDVVVLKNGDQVTGEIKQLDQGILRLSTSYMGTVQIEWDEVEQIESPQLFELEMESGVRYLGSIAATPEARQLQVAGPQILATLEHPSIIRIDPLEKGFWNRLKVSIDFGFSFTQANKDTQYNLGAEALYRTEDWAGKLNFSSLLTDQQNLDRSTRNTLGFQGNRYLKNRWFWTGLVQFQQNDELNLRLRSTLGGGFGRNLIQSNRSQLSTLGGAAYTRERFEGDETENPPLNSLEAIGGLQYSLFIFGDTDTSLSANLFVLPSLTELGRVRIEFNSRMSWEIFKDFSWNVMNLFESFDSDPPVQGDVERHDFGVSTSVGYKF
jgi:hypothetical protein